MQDDAIALLVVGMLIICAAIFCVTMTATQNAMLDYWIPGAEIKNDVVIHEGRVIEPKDIIVIHAQTSGQIDIYVDEPTD